MKTILALFISSTSYHTSILNRAVSSVLYLCIYNFPQVVHLRGYATFGLDFVVTLPARSSTNETRLEHSFR